jgi:hypothetical protein
MIFSKALLTAYLYYVRVIAASQGEWSFLSGNTALNATAAWGTKGTPSVSNSPGSRNAAAVWALANAVYVFGGVFGTNCNNSTCIYHIYLYI